MKEFITKSAAETSKVAALLGTKILSGAVIAFTVDLGAGKTTFIKGLAKALGYVGEVSSPTFAIVHEYIGGRLPLYHFDMYRVETWDDLYASGFFDFYEAGGILAVEWSENIENALPENTVRVTIQRGENDNQRIITIDGGVEI